MWRSRDGCSRSSRYVRVLRSRRNLPLAEREGRVAIRHQDEGIAQDAVVPADHPRYKVEHAARVTPREENREPRDDHDDDHRQVEKEQRDVVRDGEEPLDQWQPATEIALGIRVGKLEPHPLSLVSRWIA